MKSSIIAVLVVALVVALAARLPTWLRASTDGEGLHETLALAGCEGPSAWRSDWRPDISGAAHSAEGAYRCGDRWVHVFVAQFADQTKQAEAVSSSQMVMPYDWRGFVRSTTVATQSGDRVTEHLVERRLNEMRIWSWYAIEDSTFVSDWRTKLVEVIDAMRMRPRPVAIIAVAVAVDDADDHILEAVSQQVRSWYLRQTRMQQVIAQAGAEAR